MKINVYHKGQKINWRIYKNAFPDVATSFKGDGYFDFEVEPMSFKVNRSGLVLNIGDEILISDEFGNKIVNGYIDAIDDELSNPVEVTVYPKSLKLKDILAGEEVVINDDPDNEETATDYDTEEYKSVREIVAELAVQASQETGWNFNTDETAIPDPINPKGHIRYFGNNLIEIVRGKLRIMEDSMHFRGKNGILYLVQIDSGFVMKTLANKGDWWSVNFQLPPKDVQIGDISLIPRGQWLNTTLTLPPFDLQIPGLGAYYDIYKCEYGGITHVERITWIQGDDLENGEDNIEVLLSDKYGDRVNIRQYSNIKSQDGISSILSDMGYNLNKVYSVIDTDSFNTYALVKAFKKTNDIFGRDMLVSLETSTDFYYKAHYRNNSIMDILKDLAVVTDRYLYINSENTIHLLPRNVSCGSVSIKKMHVLELKKKTSNQDEVSVSVNRYVENEDGEPTSFGLKLRDNEWSNLENNIKSKFTGTKTQYIWKIINDPLVDLAKEILLDGIAGYGMTTGLSRNITNDTMEFTSEEYNV